MSPFEFGAAERVEAKKVTQQTEIPENLKDAAKTPEGAREFSNSQIAANKEKAITPLENSYEQHDTRIAALRNSNLSPEQMREVVQSAPELVLGNPDADPKLVQEAFRNAVQSNPSAALAFNHLYGGADRYTQIQQAIGNALRNGDAHSALGYANLLNKKDAEKVRTIGKNADPDGFRRYT